MSLTILPEEQDIDIDGDDGGDYGRALDAHDRQTSECAELGSCLLDRRCPHFQRCDDGDTIVRGQE